MGDSLGRAVREPFFGLRPRERAGPGGGGAGTSKVAVTVTVTLTPVLAPSITSQTNLESVDVGAPVNLSASTTPNKSGQIQDSGFSWYLYCLVLFGMVLNVIDF